MRRTRDQLELGAPVDLERRQVARVDPDHFGSESNGALELIRVVRLDEHVELQLRRVAEQRGGAAVVDVTQQEQRRVGAGELHLQKLQLLGEEALREQRRIGCRRACGLQIGERAVETLVDEDRHCRRSRAAERDGELDRIGARA